MFINSPPSLPMHYIWKEGPICLFNGVIDKRRYYAHRHAILALRGDEIEPLLFFFTHKRQQEWNSLVLFKAEVGKTNEEQINAR